MPSFPSKEARRLLDEFKSGRREIIKTVGPATAVALLVLLIAFYLVEPPPPRELVIAAGPRDGNYHEVARRYARLFEKNGIKLTIRETAGSVENYDLLLNDDTVHLAIVQGGTAPQTNETSRFESLATLYLEPTWVFYRRGRLVERLANLRGTRIAVGEGGSGTQLLAETLLEANGVQDGSENTVFVKETQSRTVEMLQNGDLDAAFFVLSAKSPIVQELLRDEEIELMSAERSLAYKRLYPFLDSVVLAQGAMDLQSDLPPSDVTLIAPAANLTATHALHDAFIPLLLEAAKETHEAGDLVSDPGQHPSLGRVEFPPNAIARHYLEHGPSFLQQYLGFWITSLIERTKIMLLPLIILMIPLVKLAPPFYRWRIRSRIYRWYALLREIDRCLHKNEKLREFRDKLSQVDRELEQVTVPLSYMEEFYHLRMHIDLIERRLNERLAETQTPPAEST